MKNTILAVAFLLSLGCNSSTSSAPKGSVAPPEKLFDKDDAFVTNLNTNIIGSKVSEFYSNIVDLKIIVNKACSSEALTKDLQAQWKKAMLSYHYLEAVAVGALGEDERALGRHIYSWDKTAETSRVYTQMRRAHNNENYKFKKKKVRWKGLYALELIFYDKFGEQESIQPSDKACPYIDMIADDLEIRATELSERWVTEQVYYYQDPKNKLNYGEYIGELVAQTQYVYNVVQNQKLAPLLGEENHDNITDCEKNTTEHRCVEHKFSGLMQDAIAQNLQVLQDIFIGKGGVGLIRYLQELGKQDDAAKIATLLQETVDEWGKVKEGGVFSVKVENYKNLSCSQDSLCRSYEKIVKLGQWIKSDFLLLMNAELPKPVQGDND